MRKTFLIFGVLGLMMILAAPGWAQDIKELERRIDIMSEELDQIKESGGGGGLADRVHVHGYGELHFNLPTDGGDGVFDNHRYVLGVNAKLADWIHLNVEIDFEHAAQEMEFEFGYLDFLISPKLNARAGVVLVPMGFLNEYHEPPLFWTVERPTFHKRIIPTTWNASGAGIFGSPMDGVNYRLYLVNSLQSIRPDGFDDGHGAGGNKGRFTGKEGIRTGRLQPDEGIFEDFAIAGRVELTKLLPGLQTGFSFYTGNTTQNLIPEGGRTTMLEADVKYRYRWFDMNASIAHISISDAGALNQYGIDQNALAGVGDPLAFPDIDKGKFIPSGIFGWNVQAGVHLPQLLGMSTSQDVVLFALYEFIDTQNEMPAGFAPDRSRELRILTTGVAYQPIPEVALKFDYQHTSQADGNRIDQVNIGMAYMY